MSMHVNKVHSVTTIDRIADDLVTSVNVVEFGV